MEQNEIIEGNKLIAEFMGAKFIDPIGHAKRYIQFPIVTGGLYVQSDAGLLYHSSWLWLMPVVEKIEAMGYASVIHGYGMELTPHLETFCSFKEGNYRRGHGEAKSKIEAVYLAVIDFLKWYNGKGSSSVG